MTGHNTKAEKDRMRALWRARGPHWVEQADRIAELAERMNRPLIECADIATGQNVLDLASGAGEPALSLAHLIGPEGTVVATDLVEEMLAGCRRRAADAALENIRFEIADMEDLPYPSSSFDRVTCRFGIMFVPDPVRALAEARRVLKDGGRAAFMVWGPRVATTLMEVLAAAGTEVFGDDERLDFTTPFRFGVPGTLAEMFDIAGYDAVAEHDFHFAPEVPVGRPFWDSQLRMSMGPRLDVADDAELAALDRAIRAQFEAYRDGDVFKLRAHSRVVTGIAKPE